MSPGSLPRGTASRGAAGAGGSAAGAARWLAVAVVGLVGAGGWLVLGSDALDVDAVSVEGTHLLTPAAVEQAAAVAPGAPLARVDLDAVAARVEGLPAVDSAEVTATGRAPCASWSPSGRPSPWSRRRATTRAWTPTGCCSVATARRHRRCRWSAPTTWQAAVSDDDAVRADALQEVALVVESLPPAVAGKVDHVELASLDSIELVLADGSLVRWGSADESGLKADVLATLMSVPATTYDVSVPGLPTTSG